MINWKRSGPWLTNGPKRHSHREMSEDLPIDILPASNEESERQRRKLNMSRGEFVRTTGAIAIGFWAIDAIRPGLFGNYGWAHNTPTTAALTPARAPRAGG